MTTTLQSALYLAKLGYAVFPCAPGQKRPATKNGLLDASADEEVVGTLWANAPASCNLALRTDGLLVLDIDGAENEWLKDQPEKLLELTAAPCSVTPRGGRHIFYRQPDGQRFRNTAGKLADKVDTRGDGGYVLLPPSVVDGKAYRSVNALDCEPEKLPLPPAWLIAMLGPAVRSTPVAGDGNLAEFNFDATDPIPDGQRDITLTRLAGTLRRPGLNEDAMYAALAAVNASRCKPPLPDSEVRKIVHSVHNYPPDLLAVAAVEGFSDSEPARAPEVQEQIPAKLLHIPGFVDEVIDHCLATAPYPNLALAFSAAMPLQGFLASRKVTDASKATRSSIYVVAAANSGAGKDWPRRVARSVLQSCGLNDHCGDGVSSGEGLEDALFLKPSFFLLADEFHYMLAAIKNGKDVRWQGIANALLKFYTSAASVYDMRLKAGQENSRQIQHPALTVSASAIPSRLFDAMSPEVLSGGLFARLIVIQAGPRGRGRKPIDRDLPATVVEAAKHWADLKPGPGNLATETPSPMVVSHSPEADKLLCDFQSHCDDQYAKCEHSGDDIGTSVWARAGEKAWRVALIYACSLDWRQPHLPLAGAQWSAEFVEMQTRQMLWMAGTHSSESEAHSDQLKIERAIAEWVRKNPHKPMPPSALRKRLRSLKKRDYDDALATLVESGKIALRQIDHGGAGRPAIGYVALAM